MILQWPYVQLALSALEPSTIVEIGSAKGGNTAKVAAFAAERGAVLHSVDPKPRFDVSEYESRWPGTFIPHRGLSLDVLPDLPAPDAALIDGDHNWYTVINELRGLEKLAARDERVFPLVMMHDIDWPYGRRDMYYAPETIPAEFRQPYIVGGVAVGRMEPQPNRDFNAGILHATEEGTPRNGVLTAAEDFVEETDLPLRLQSIAGFHGLGIISDLRLLESKPALNEVLTETFNSADFYRSHCDLLVDQLNRIKTAGSNARHRQRRLEARNAALEEQVAELKAESEELQRRLRSEVR